MLTETALNRVRTLRPYRTLNVTAALIALALVAAACGSASGDDGVTPIRWFVGLGAGTDAPLIPQQQAIVDEFNAAHDDIQLELEVAPESDQAVTLLQTQISGRNAPDIVGPVGVRGAAQFFGGWLDLAPYLDQFDTTGLDQRLIDFWRQEDVQIGLPFALFPQVLWFNKALFDEVGLAYPPQEFEAPYVDADGNERQWDIDTMTELAIRLTVDSEGRTPNDEDFDPDARVQWGFGNMLTDFRGMATMFGAASFVADDDETCQFPDSWRTATTYYHDAMSVDYHYPDPIFAESEILGSGGNWFGSGNLAMGAVHTWYAGWGTADLRADFDIAAMPAAPDGEPVAKLHADTFSIPVLSENHEQAVEALAWMMSPEIAPKLAAIYGGLPARAEAQQAYIDNPANDFGFDWSVAVDALDYPDVPSHESWWPNFIESTDAMAEWWTTVTNDPNADLQAEIARFCDVLQPVFDRSPQ